MRGARNGFTLVELLVVLVLGAVILGGAYQTLVRQEQSYGQMNAMMGTREDARIGLELLSAELREVTTDTARDPAAVEAGIDVLMATQDSIRIRSLRKFGLLCDKDKNAKRLLVAQLGADPFAAGDTVLVYVDQDLFMAEDDVWQREVVTSVAGGVSCTTSFGSSLGTLLPGANLRELTLAGMGLKFDSVYIGAPLRSFETFSYRVDTSTGQPMLSAVRNDTVYPLVGPLVDPNGLILRYFAADGTALTSFPLSVADRKRIRRVRIVIRAERDGSSASGAFRDSLFTDVHLRGS